VRRNPVSPNVTGDKEVSAWTTLRRAYYPGSAQGRPTTGREATPVAATQLKLSESGHCPQPIPLYAE